jgi:ferric-dicitrate binding protein FerR (iron transport regulator)
LTRTYLFLPLVMLLPLAAGCQTSSPAPDVLAPPANQTPQDNDARATFVAGQVSRVSGQDLPWALSAGERVAVQQMITTGPDGEARFEVTGGTTFEIFSRSRVYFRKNAASAGDLIDIEEGRVKVDIRFGAQRSSVQRVFTETVVITARANASITVAVEDDGTTRVDVQQGQVLVQHALLPNGDATVVKAGDAISVHKNEPISRRIDRGSLYRYVFRSIVDALSVYGAKRIPDHDLLGESATGESTLAQNFQGGTSRLKTGR